MAKPKKPKSIKLTLGANGAPIQQKAPNAFVVGGRARLPKIFRRHRASKMEVSYLTPEELARRREAAGLPSTPDDC